MYLHNQSKGPLGCSVKYLSNMLDSYYSVSWGWDASAKRYNAYTPSGVKNLKEWAGGDNRNGIVVWTDTSRGRDGRDHSGEKFYEYLKSQGEHVEKSNQYPNEGHEGLCTLYIWYTNPNYKPPQKEVENSGSGRAVKPVGRLATRRSVPNVGGKPKAKTVKAASNRAPVKRGRLKAARF